MGIGQPVEEVARLQKLRSLNGRLINVIPLFPDYSNFSRFFGEFVKLFRAPPNLQYFPLTNTFFLQHHKWRQGTKTRMMQTANLNLVGWRAPIVAVGANGVISGPQTKSPGKRRCAEMEILIGQLVP